MTGPRDHPRVFTVPPGAPFLPVLADSLLSGDLVAFAKDDPLALAGVTVLLPTRRAARAFSDVLIERLGPDAAILPSIRPIGDVDEDEHLLDPFVAATEDRLLLPQSIEPLTRRLALTRLTLAWASGVRRDLLRIADDEPLRIPASAADATRLAADLERLADDMAIAGMGWDRIATLVPQDHAGYYQLTLDFLKIVSEAWPQYLRDNSRADPAARRDLLIRAAAARIERGVGPVIAAGSTGSIPATAELLRVIARRSNGAVVLPGLDQHLDAAGWTAIGDAEAMGAAQAHPQFGLKQLIGAIGVSREDVVSLGAVDPTCVARATLLSQAMRPADTLDAWAGLRPAPDALTGMDLIVARNEQEEAAAIALAIREAIEKPATIAALVTPDRTLARRVAVELGRWGLAIDVSAGAPLDGEPHGVFARLLAEAAASAADPVKLLALVKHPFAAFGMAKAQCRDAARCLEVALFRGHRVANGIAGLPAALAARRAGRQGGDHIPASRRRLAEHQWDLAAGLVDALVMCLAPLEAAVSGQTTAAIAAALLHDCLSRAATDDTGTDHGLWQQAGGAALAMLLDGLATDHEAAALPLGPGDFPFFFGALLGDIRVQRPAGVDPRIHIWGTLEARLQSVDLLVLGGMDEGVWPAATRTDPWLSRAMRAAIELPPPERRLGLAAHDFCQAAAAPRVIVTRAEKRDGAPTVESRWLQRLRALVGKEEAARLTARGARFVDYARRLDRVSKDQVAPVKRPEPRPPLATRPKGLSITEIETLIRDPYAIYARRILKLEPLDPIGRPPDGGLRGTLVHKALGDFTKEWRGPFDSAAEARLNAIATEVLREVADFPDVHAVWTIRLAAIARWLVGFEFARDHAVAQRHAEIDGTLPVIPNGFTLRGRADRVDLMANGTVAIYDYKTSTPQTDRSVFAGLTPQMALEAAMARAGGFPGIPAGRSVSELAWLAVGRIGREDPYQTAVLNKQTADGLADDAHRHLIELATAFANPDHPYRSRTRPRMENARYIGDYDHLARVREWALVESPEDVVMMGGGSP